MATLAIILACWFFSSCIVGVVVGKMIVFGASTCSEEYLEKVESLC